MERFLLVQGDNKKRLVDNCRKTEHNMHASLFENLYSKCRLCGSMYPRYLSSPETIRLRPGEC